MHLGNYPYHPQLAGLESVAPAISQEKLMHAAIVHVHSEGEQNDEEILIYV